MTDKTKACNLTYEEIEILIESLGYKLSNNAFTKAEVIERINYFSKRLKSFSEPETKSEPNAAGWANAPASSKGEDE